MNSDARWRVRPARPADWPAIRELLVASELPLEGAADHLAHFIVAESAGELAGCAGLEVYDEVALLRSCAVDAAYQHQGLGHHLVQQAIEHASTLGVHELALLTTTAETYFARFGFLRISRDDVADALKVSREFRGACPASACVMRRRLDG